VSERQSIGAALDGMGIHSTLKDGDLIDGAVVIMRVIESDGRIRHSQAWSEGLDWITRRGLLEIARDTDRQAPIPDDEDEEPR
jgi:hypothetical protein